ncbi:DgyrCDS3159 [Dimorphilus gyrociliatus]|uniref:DgyrCDS3159 n=1 Tax=Dimorphilus gyrociliatus TaxID=2664684 RepID=A0A7I8VE88_9ANNE|nr:DgyrCDS3159 [Dimorphilus gyrociliatus]
MGVKTAFQLEKAGIKNIGKNFLSFQAFEAISVGELVDVMRGNVVKQKSRFTVQISKNLHMDVVEPIKYTNHSCNPNCKLDVKTGQLTAVKAIKPGQNITFDYCTTEYEMEEHFKCNCESDKCRGFIQGFKYLKPNEKKLILPKLSECIKENYLNEEDERVSIKSVE